MVLDWSPNGERLLLSRRFFDMDPKMSSNLFEFDLATEKCMTPLLLGTEKLSIQHARYSPSGDEIAVLWSDPRNQYAPNECAVDATRGGHSRILCKLSLIGRDGESFRLISDHSYGQRGPTCWSPDGKELLLSRYLPPDDDREAKEGSHGLGIWAVKADGSGDEFITTGWSPDWR